MRKILMGMVLWSSLCGALVTGCGGEDGVECTALAAASVTVTVVDSSGAAVNDALVQYSVDGGPQTDCEQPGADGTYVCAYETAGAFTITATRGGMSGTATATVTADECHVMGQQVKITLGT